MRLTHASLCPAWLLFKSISLRLIEMKIGHKKVLGWAITFAVMFVFVLTMGLWWPSQIKYNPQDLSFFSDQYLADQEAPFQDLKPEVRKRVIWAHADKSMTEISLVYIHGFSATSAEISPVMESLAEKMKANLYFARLEGHGLDGVSLGKASPQKWLDESVEAFEIGKKLGKKVILVGTSTGATLALAVALHNPENVAGLVMISPNFRPNAWATLLFTGPLGKFWVKTLAGSERSWTPRNPEVMKYWTTRYDSEAIVTMMEDLKFVNALKFEDLKVPLRVLYTEKDEVVNVSLIKSSYERLGSPDKELISVPSNDHVLAGKYQSPETTDWVIERLLPFIQKIQTQSL